MKHQTLNIHSRSVYSCFPFKLGYMQLSHIYLYAYMQHTYVCMLHTCKINNLSWLRKRGNTRVPTYPLLPHWSHQNSSPARFLSSLDWQSRQLPLHPKTTFRPTGHWWMNNNLLFVTRTPIPDSKEENMQLKRPCSSVWQSSLSVIMDRLSWLLASLYL